MAGIDNRKDILLLLLYLQGASGEMAEPVNGRTRLMKLLFLLSKEHNLGETLRINFYEFEPHDFGPFSKDVFEDINFLQNVNLIHAKPNGAPHIIQQWEDEEIIQSSVPDDEMEEVNNLYMEEEFRLTSKGKDFVERMLLTDLKEKGFIKEQIESIKREEGSLSLTNLLKLVYEKYPESASKTTLKHLVQ